MRSLVVLIAACAISTAQEKTIKLPRDHATAELKAGADAQLTRNNCIICHSTDYIVRQPPSNAKQWDAEVQKMVKVYGAPISEADARRIAAYLGAAYGPESRGK